MKRMTDIRLAYITKYLEDPGYPEDVGEYPEMVADLIAELRASREDHAQVLSAIQRHQPAGSPPPGDAAVLVNWIMSDLVTQRNSAQRLADHWSKVNRVKCADCEKDCHPVTDAYRCHDCEKFYCPVHALGHFGSEGPLMDRIKAERDRLQAYINNPVTQDFLEALKVEIPHQKERWKDTDPLKMDPEWYWLIGWLGAKALCDPVEDRDARTPKERKLHRIVTIAAAAANWHQTVMETP